MRQCTIDDALSFDGINVFSGRPAAMTIHPANEDEGIRFLYAGNNITATLTNAQAVKKKGASTIGLTQNGTTIYKVEHLLAALYACRIDNAVVELAQDSVPRLPWCVGSIAKQLDVHRFKQDGEIGAWAFGGIGGAAYSHPTRDDTIICSMQASPNPYIVYKAEYPHKSVGKQIFRYQLTPSSFVDQISEARAPFFLPGFLLPKYFGSLPVHLTKPFHGVRLDNSLIIGSKSDKEYLSQPHDKYGQDEFVRHKVMDFLGALALTGKRLIHTKFEVIKSGHQSDLDALRQFEKNKRYVLCEEKYIDDTT